MLKGDDAQYDHLELTLVTAAGSTPVSVQTAPFEVDGKTAGAVLVLRDMTRERDLIARLSWQASHDELTGLANRRELDRRLRARMAESTPKAATTPCCCSTWTSSSSSTTPADTPPATSCLREVATLLKLELDESCLPVRLGGDEFAVILTDATSFARRKSRKDCEAPSRT